LVLTLTAACGGGTAGDAMEYSDDGGSMDGGDAPGETEVDGLDAVGDESPDGPPDLAVPCGNGVLDPDEECDDGNRLDGDDCDWLCHLGDGVWPGPPDADTPRLEPEGEPAPLDGSWPPARDPACYRVPLLWTGDAYAVLWATTTGERFVRFNRTGTRVGAEVTLPVFLQVDAAWSGSLIAIVWCEDDASWMQRLTKDGATVGTPVQLVRRPGEYCESIAVAWNGVGFDVFAVWGERSLRFVRTGPDAMPVTPDVLVYDRVGPGRSLTCVSAAAAPEAGLAAVLAQDTDDRRTEVSVVDLEGTVLQAGSPIAEHYGYPPAAAWDGSQFGVLTFGTTPSGESLYLARFSAMGELLAPPTLIVVDRTGAANALAAGLGWAATTIDNRPMAGGFLVARMDREGRPVQQSSLSGPGWDEFEAPAIGLAFDGEGFGIVGVGDDPPWFARFVLER
jgi:cysteine-rich repeat protein